MQPIVVGLDGSPSSAAALRWALGAASSSRAELLLVSVVPEGADAQAIEVAMLREWAGEVEATAVPFRTEVVEGVAGPALTAVAAGVGDCLVVVGQGHDEWFPARHLGSASHYLAQHVDRPLCIVPGGNSLFDPSHIVVGLDGSAGSTAAAQWAANLAARSGGKVTAIYAWHRCPTRMTKVDSPDPEVDADRACRSWAGGLDAAGILTEARAVEGDAVEVLAAAVATVGTGLVVLGTSAGVRRGDVRLGRVALHVLEFGEVPVVLVPASPGA